MDQARGRWVLDPPRIVENSYVRLDITMKFLAWWLSMGANLRIKMSMEIETRGLEGGGVGLERKRRKIVDCYLVYPRPPSKLQISNF